MENINMSAKSEIKTTDIIKHLVFSGGGPAGLITYGAVKQLEQANVWSLSNIQSMYGCSIGAYLAVVLSLVASLTAGRARDLLLFWRRM